MGRSRSRRRDRRGRDRFEFDPGGIETWAVAGPFGNGFCAGDYLAARRFFLWALREARLYGVKKPVFVMDVRTERGEREVWVSAGNWEDFRQLLTRAWAEQAQVDPTAYVVESSEFVNSAWGKRATESVRQEAASWLLIGVAFLIAEAATDLADLFPALPKSPPRANRNGWLELNIGRCRRLCRTRRGWAELLKNKPPSGYPRIQKTAVLTQLNFRPGIEALDWWGRVSQGVFYTKEDLREIFPDHFILLHRLADDNGFFLDAQGIRLGTIPAWINAFIESGRVPKYWANHPYDNFVGRYLRQYCAAGDGIDNNGLVQRRAFYSESDAEFALALWNANKRLTELQTPAGLMLCGSTGVLVDYFASREDLPNINHWLMTERLNQARRSGQLRGRSVRRGHYSVYGLPLALEVFAPEIEQHRARATDARSYFRVNPVTGVVERYAPFLYWVDYVRSLGLDTNPKRLRRQLNALKLEAHTLTLPVEGLRPIPLWPESVVFSCPIVVGAVPELNEDNTLTVKKEKHHELEYWAELLQIPVEELAVHLRDTPSRLGKRRDGRVVRLYGQSVIAQASRTWRPAEPNPAQPLVQEGSAVNLVTVV